MTGLMKNIWGAPGHLVVAATLGALTAMSTWQASPAWAQLEEEVSTAPDNNPDAVRSCDVDLAILLDASGSIGLYNNNATTPEDERDRNGSYDIMIDGVKAVLGAVQNSGSRVSISSYNATARTHVGFTEVTDTNLEANGVFDIALGDPGDAESGIPQVNTGYVDHGITAVEALNEGGTNWEAGLSEVRDLIMPGTDLVTRPGVPLLVLHLTDGKPNVYTGEDGNFVFDPDDDISPLARAVDVADEIKEDLGAHTITVAVGGIVSRAIDNLTAISGPDVFDVADPDSALDLRAVDLFLAEEPTRLGAVLSTMIGEFCAPRLVIRQWNQEKTNAGDYVATEGWRFDANPGAAEITKGKKGAKSGGAYSWHTPMSRQAVATDINGAAEFQWLVSNDEVWNESRVTVDSLDLGDTWEMEGVFCQATTGGRAGEQVDPMFLQNDGSFSVDIQNLEVITCDVYNRYRHGKGKSEAAKLAIDQTVQTSSFSCPGDKIEYSYRVTNVGDQRVSDSISVFGSPVTDTQCPEITGGKVDGALSADESITCSGTYLVTQDDVDNGYVKNNAWAVSGQLISATDESRVFGGSSTTGSGSKGKKSGEKAVDCGLTDTTDDSTDDATTADGSEETTGQDGALMVDERVAQSTSATRDAKWFAQNQSFVAACVDSLGGQIDLGSLVIRDEAYDDEVDATVKGRVRGDLDADAESAFSMAVGLLNARGGKLSDGRRRGALARSCVRASQQMLVAQCNVAVFGVQPAFDLSRQIKRLGKFCGASSAAGAEKKKVNRVRAKLNKFNRSGVDVALPQVDVDILETRISGDDPTDGSD